MTFVRSKNLYCILSLIRYFFQHALCNLQCHSYYAYIDLGCHDSTETKLRLKFRVDNSPLGEGFLMKCSDIEFSDSISFKGSYLDNTRDYFYFGRRPFHNFSYLSNLKTDAEKYSKPMTKGAIGLYNVESHHSIRVCDINVYIIMAETLYAQMLPPYVSYEPKTRHTLKYCFGEVTEGLEALEELTKSSDQPLIEFVLLICKQNTLMQIQILFIIKKLNQINMWYLNFLDYLKESHLRVF